MILAAWRDAIATAPIAFAAGLFIGFWIGGRFTIRKHGDDHDRMPGRRHSD